MAKQPQKDFQNEMLDDLTGGNSPEVVMGELNNLFNQPGWKRIKDVVDKKAQDIGDEILNTDVQEEELNRLRDRRDLCLWFGNLPVIMVKAMQMPNMPVDTELDPYERIDNQEDKPL